MYTPSHSYTAFPKPTNPIYPAITSSMGSASMLAQPTMGAFLTPSQLTSVDQVKFGKKDDDEKPKGLDRVAGMHELKKTLREEVIAPLREPEKFKKYGLTIPNGILLYGPPGCGKTFIIDALAEELGFELRKETAATMQSKWVGETEKAIAGLFKELRNLVFGKKDKKVILFIDEAEALIPSRDSAERNWEISQVNQFLMELNKAGEQGILVVLATNRPDKLDEAATRTGRCDRKIFVGPPDLEARGEIIKHHTSKREHKEENIDYDKLAEATKSFSASDLEALANLAAHEAMKTDSKIDTQHFLQVIKDEKIKGSIDEKKELKYKSYFETKEPIEDDLDLKKMLGDNLKTKQNNNNATNKTTPKKSYRKLWGGVMAGLGLASIGAALYLGLVSMLLATPLMIGVAGAGVVILAIGLYRLLTKGKGQTPSNENKTPNKAP